MGGRKASSKREGLTRKKSRCGRSPDPGKLLRMCPEKVWKPMEGRERPQKVMESHRRLRNSWEGTKQV